MPLIPINFDPAHTTVTWSANHFGFSDPHGVFSLIEGTLSLDETDPAKSNVDVTINSGNLFTGNKKFDDHLKSKDFFNIGEFPKITFRSSKVELTGPKTAKVTGNLEMLGKTQPVVLDVTYNKKGPNVLSGKTTVGFSAKTVVKALIVWYGIRDAGRFR